jgi:hypothetical protein
MEMKTTIIRGMKIVGFPSEREIIGMVCKIPMNKKYTG